MKHMIGTVASLTKYCKTIRKVTHLRLQTSDLVRFHRMAIRVHQQSHAGFRRDVLDILGEHCVWCARVSGSVEGGGKGLPPVDSKIRSD